MAKDELHPPAPPYHDAGFAAAYDALAVPHYFEAPADDLVSLVGARPSGALLDLGAGTGAVTRRAARLPAAALRLVALDPSPAMLGVLRKEFAGLAVAGRAPGLPFRDGVFDAVLANFVVSHLLERERALADIVRVLRPGGRLGVSAWGAGQSEFARLWADVAARHYSRELLLRAFRAVIPWDEWFADEAHLRQDFEGAGLVDVVVLRREYRARLGIEEFLAIREASVEGRLLQRGLGAAEWQQFRQRVRAEFLARFPPLLDYVRAAHLAFGTKP